MNDLVGMFWPAAIGGIILLVWGVRAYRSGRHRRQIARFAMARGFRYSPGARRGVPHRLRGFWFARRGHNLRTAHLLQGSGPPGTLLLFELTSEIGSGGFRRELVRSVGAAFLNVDIPAILIAPLQECRAAAATMGYGLVDGRAEALPPGHAVAAEDANAAAAWQQIGGWPAPGPNEFLESCEAAAAVYRPGRLTSELAEELLERLGPWSLRLRELSGSTDRRGG